jgi:hypothetical protein
MILPHLQFKPTKKCALRPGGKPKSFRYPRIVKPQIADQSTCYQVHLSDLLDKMVFDQIQCYFTVNKLTKDFQHAFSTGAAGSQVVKELD